MKGKMGKGEGNIPAWPGIMELQKEQPVERPGKKHGGDQYISRKQLCSTEDKLIAGNEKESVKNVYFLFF